MSQAHFLDARIKGYQRTRLDTCPTGVIIKAGSREPDIESINRESPNQHSKPRVGELMGSEGVELFVDMVS